MTEIVGVVDCGRARWKLRTWVWDGQALTPRSRATLEIGEAVVDGVKRVAAEAKSWLDQEGANRLAVVGAAAFRDDPTLASHVQTGLGTGIRVLSPSEEARLLAAAVRASTDLEAGALVVDLGGGSIQVAKVANEAEWASLPLGTHVIEERFSLPQGSPQQAYDAAKIKIEREVRDQLNGLSAETVVAGSNCYADFFNGLANLTGRPPRSPAHGNDFSSQWTREELTEAYPLLQRLPEAEFGSVMPALPGFMYGADKAVLVLLCVMEAAGAHRTLGTNLGVADGLATALVQAESHSSSPVS